MISNENRYAEEYFVIHGSALEGSDPHELAAGFEVCQMKGTHIGSSELTLFKSNEVGLLTQCSGQILKRPISLDLYKVGSEDPIYVPFTRHTSNPATNS